MQKPRSYQAVNYAGKERERFPSTVFVDVGCDLRYVLIELEAKELSDVLTWIKGDLASEPVIGVDCESGEHGIRLLQLSSRARCVLIRIPDHFEWVNPDLKALLEDVKIFKSGADLWGDAIDIYTSLGIKMNGIFDLTHYYYKERGRVLGLEDMAKEVLGKKTFIKDRRMTLSNWDAAKLTRRQLKYAALDARVSCLLALKLMVMDKYIQPVHLEFFPDQWLREAGRLRLQIHLDQRVEETQESVLDCHWIEAVNHKNLRLHLKERQDFDMMLEKPIFKLHLVSGRIIACMMSQNEDLTLLLCLPTRYSTQDLRILGVSKITLAPWTPLPSIRWRIANYMRQYLHNNGKGMDLSYELNRYQKLYFCHRISIHPRSSLLEYDDEEPPPLDQSPLMRIHSDSDDSSISSSLTSSSSINSISDMDKEEKDYETMSSVSDQSSLSTTTSEDVIRKDDLLLTPSPQWSPSPSLSPAKAHSRSPPVLRLPAACHSENRPPRRESVLKHWNIRSPSSEVKPLPPPLPPPQTKMSKMRNGYNNGYNGYDSPVRHSMSQPLPLKSQQFKENVAPPPPRTAPVPITSSPSNSNPKRQRKKSSPSFPTKVELCKYWNKGQCKLEARQCLFAHGDADKRETWAQHLAKQQSPNHRPHSSPSHRPQQMHGTRRASQSKVQEVKLVKEKTIGQHSGSIQHNEKTRSELNKSKEITPVITKKGNMGRKKR